MIERKITGEELIGMIDPSKEYSVTLSRNNFANILTVTLGTVDSIERTKTNKVSETLPSSNAEDNAILDKIIEMYSSEIDEEILAQYKKVCNRTDYTEFLSPTAYIIH